MRIMLQGLDGMSPVDVDILRFQCLTGTRIGEASGAELVNEKIDLTERQWTIRHAHEGVAPSHGRVSLPAGGGAAGAAGQPRGSRLRRAQGRGRCPSNGRSGATNSNFPADFTSHVVRKALLTWVADHGGGRDIRDRLSAHSPGKSADAHYQLSELNAPAAEWWQRWAGPPRQMVEAGGKRRRRSRRRGHEAGHPTL